MRNRRIIVGIGIGIAAALALTIAGCAAGSDTGDQRSPAASVTATASAADVAFAQSMIPHHQQAVAMADMALDPAAQASAEVQALATQIKAAQDPEIQQMTTWLTEWGQPTTMPGASPGYAMGDMDMSGHDMGGMTMSGMMSQQQMDQLAGMHGDDFDQMWLQMMTEHHQGAIDMADQVAQTTTNPEVAALAADIVEAQQAEIATMQEMMK
jgi:uncharacterized protein (DUF305 family)